MQLTTEKMNQAEKIRLEEDQRYQRKLREAKHGVKGH